MREPDRIFDKYHKNIGLPVEKELLETVNVPESWHEINYKEYRRTEKIKKPEMRFSGFMEKLRSRASMGEVKNNQDIKKVELFKILESSYGETRSEKRRPVASGGARYPLEIYLIASRCELDKGLYHYSVKNDELEKIEALENPEEFISENWIHIHDSDTIGAMIVITSRIERSERKYGEKSYLFSAIETGSVLQNLQLSSRELGIGSRPYSGFYTGEVRDLLELSRTQEKIMLTVALCKN